MSGAASMDLPDTECCLCHGDITVPKILPCAHLVCRDCLVTWLKSNSKDQCPLCLCTIVDPADRSSETCEAIADGLPTDLAMAAFLESSRILKKEHVCRGCVGVNATGICLHCGDLLCQSCTTAHGKLSVSRHHEVESLTSLTPERLSASLPASCKAHSDRPPELFCPTHGVSVCLLCAMSDHQKCDKERLEKKVVEARALLEELVKTLSKGEQSLERAISQMNQRLMDIDKNTRAAIAEIDAACDRLQTSVEKCRRRLKDLLKGASSHAKTAMDGWKTVLLQRSRKMTSHKRLAERAQKTTPLSDMEAMTSTIQCRVAALDYSTTLPADVEKVMKKLTVDPRELHRLDYELDSIEMIPQFQFHSHHGKNIALSADMTGAERVSGTFDGIALSADPVATDMLYEVELSHRGTGNHFFRLGVTDKDPVSLILPSNSDYWAVACAVCGAGVKVRGKMVDSPCNIGQSMTGLPAGSRVGVLVDNAGCLHLYKNGADLGIVVEGVSQPCFAYFDCQQVYDKVVAQPLRHVEGRRAL